LNTTLAGFGVKLNGTALTIEATPDNFSLKKNNIVQAMLAVNDTFYLARPYVKSLFFEDVVKWLDTSEIRYTPQVNFIGKSGFDHRFHFVIPKSPNFGERVLETLTNPSKGNAQSLIFKWRDIKENRTSDSMLFAMLNDTQGPVSAGVITALHNYDVYPVLWSQREHARGRLAA